MFFSYANIKAHDWKEKKCSANSCFFIGKRKSTSLTMVPANPLVTRFLQYPLDIFCCKHQIFNKEFKTGAIVVLTKNCNDVQNNGLPEKDLVIFLRFHQVLSKSKDSNRHLGFQNLALIKINLKIFYQSRNHIIKTKQNYAWLTWLFECSFSN